MQHVLDAIDHVQEKEAQLKDLAQRAVGEVQIRESIAELQAWSAATAAVASNSYPSVTT